MDRLQASEDTVLDTGTGLRWTRDAALAEFPLSWGEVLALFRIFTGRPLPAHMIHAMSGGPTPGTAWWGWDTSR